MAKKKYLYVVCYCFIYNLGRDIHEGHDTAFIEANNAWDIEEILVEKVRKKGGENQIAKLNYISSVHREEI